MDRRLVITTLAALLAGCATSRQPEASSKQDGFAPWSMTDRDYVLFPGDEIDITLSSAPELSRQVTIGPDGRVSLPIIGHVMAAERTVSELEGSISSAYGDALLRPAVEVSMRRPGPMKVWVDGQVRTPGMFDLPAGTIDAYQAIVMAGGALPTARTKQAALIRRSADGTRMMMIVDLRPNQSGGPTIMRGDIIFVPRTALGELTAFFTQIRDSLPVGFSYALNGRWA